MDESKSDRDREISSAQVVASKLLNELKQVIRGRDDTIKLVLTAIFADGHVLLEDYPGSGKTTLTKALGSLIEADDQVIEGIAPFKRIQFTPDMLPGDILEVNVFDPKSGGFNFLRGPVFAHVVLADEINRTGPKVQAAFLECMAEKQVTMDNVTYPLDKLFFVIGTQNPLDIAGTYPLPLVQLDGFLLRVPMSYVNTEIEIEILTEHDKIVSSATKLAPVCRRSEILKAQQACRSIEVHPALTQAIVEIVQATRSSSELQFGASTRAAIMFQAAIRAWAMINSRTYCNEDDLKFICPYVLLHRLKFHGSSGPAHDALARIIQPILEKLVRRGIS